jgi:membrane protein
MARPSMPVLIRPRDLWRLARQAVDAWIDDYAPSMGAALAFYTMFSIAPLFVIVIAVAGLAYGADAAEGRIIAELGGLIGTDGATAVQGLIRSASSKGASVVASLVGFGVLLVGATTVFSELQSDLDRIWQAPRASRPSGVWGLLRARFLSFGLILGIGFILLVSLVLSAVLTAIGTWWSPFVGHWQVVLEVLDFVIGLVVITLLFAMIYKLLPSVPIAWRDVWTGAIVTAILFSVGKYLIGLYIGKSGVVSGFGATGSLAVLLLWVYYSAQIFLLGAEFTFAYAHGFGSLRGMQTASAGTPAPASIGSRPAMARPPDDLTTSGNVVPPLLRAWHADARPSARDREPSPANFWLALGVGIAAALAADVLARRVRRPR